VAAAWAAVVSYGPLALLSIVGALGSGGTAVGGARFALGAWLLGHGVPLTTPTDQITLVPLAASALAAWRVARAGVHASRATHGHRDRSVRPALTGAIAVALAYAVLGASAAILARTPTLAVSPLRAATTCGLFGLTAAAVGALVASRAARARLRRVPAVVTGGVRLGVVVAVLLVATGAAMTGAAVAVRAAEASDMLSSYRAGLLGQAGITALCLAYAPNLAVWGVAYLLGPGFAVGLGTTVGPGAVVLGPLPVVPVLAALPEGPATGPWAALTAVPLIIAVVSAIILARRRGQAVAPARWSEVLGGAALAGPVAGVLIQAAAVASSGALGSGRLSALGPGGWRVGVLAAVVVSLGALVGSAVVRAFGSRQR
jgi:Family of unknown function (DUF6350)